MVTDVAKLGWIHDSAANDETGDSPVVPLVLQPQLG
jgi:hypothetical protein